MTSQFAARRSCRTMHRIGGPSKGGCARRLISLAKVFAGYFVLCIPFLALAPAARAELIVQSATDFVARCPCTGDQIDNSEVRNGVLKTIDSDVRYYSSVSFPADGAEVCSFSLIYHDINANDTMIARLLRKTFVLNAGNTFSPPLLMAQVRTAPGTSNAVRRARTSDIGNAVVSKADSFYFVEIRSPTFNLNVLGVQIDVRPAGTCPQS